MEPRYVLRIAYDGRPFHGWQRQPNVPTVQGVLEERLSSLLQQPIHIVGSGRTDAGVHAISQYAHFDFDGNLPEGFLKKLNLMLPKSIYVYRCYRCLRSFHARFFARWRSYLYVIATQNTPFLHPYAYVFLEPLDLVAMQEGASYLIGVHDFTTFAKKHGGQKDFYTRVKRLEITATEGLIMIFIEAARFLRAMVRMIVGSLLEVGTHKRSPQWIKTILEAKNNQLSAPLAPAHGLYLYRVDYPPAVMQLHSQLSNPLLPF